MCNTRESGYQVTYITYLLYHHILKKLTALFILVCTTVKPRNRLERKKNAILIDFEIKPFLNGFLFAQFHQSTIEISRKFLIGIFKNIFKDVVQVFSNVKKKILLRLKEQCQFNA